MTQILFSMKIVTMEDLITIFIVGIIILCIFLQFESKYSELTYVKSPIDGNKYLVRNREDKQEAADKLALIKVNLSKIVEHVKNNNISDPKVRRLVEKYRPEQISESLPNTNYTSYSVNKGEKLVFCIRSKKTGKIVDTNTMMFVAIHELAHVMTKSVGHTPEFWDNMRYLLKKGIKIGVYKAVDYKSKPVSYCGISITDSPL